MTGKNKCRILKEIRQRIADENDIPYVTRECSFQGECTGTCPRCESELRYLEQQLERRRSLGKRVSVAALCAGIALAATGCTPSGKPNIGVFQNDLTGEAAPTESYIEELTGEVGPEESYIDDLSGDVVFSDTSSEPDVIELSGEAAWPEGCDSAESKEVMDQTMGVVAWPET